MARRVFNFIKNAPLSGRLLSEKTASLNKYSTRGAFRVLNYSKFSSNYLVAALDADLVELLQDLFDPQNFFLLSGLVHDGVALMHHQEAAAVLHRIAEVVGYHDGGEVLSLLPPDPSVP